MQGVATHGPGRKRQDDRQGQARILLGLLDQVLCQFQQERGFTRTWLPQDEQFLLCQLICLDNGGVR